MSDKSLIIDLGTTPPGGSSSPKVIAPPPGPGEPLGMLDFAELPDTYGVDECEVMFRDPHTIFVYWEVTDSGTSAARAQLGPSAADARLVLRVFVTQGQQRHVQDHPLQLAHGRRYFTVPAGGAHLRVAVGLLSGEGFFAPVAHSSLLRMPPAGPASPGAVRWMRVAPARSRGLEREPPLVDDGLAGTEHAERGANGGSDPPPPLGSSMHARHSARPPHSGSGGLR